MFALLVERLQLRPVEDLVANRVVHVREPAIEIADLEALRSAAAACVTDQPEHDDRDHEQGNDPGHRLGKKQGVGKQKFGHGGLWVGSMLENRVVARQNRFCSYGRQVQQPVTFFDLCCAANQLAYTSQAAKKRFIAIRSAERRVGKTCVSTSRSW